MKNLLFLMIACLALAGCNKNDSVTQKMLIGEWNCDPVEQRQSTTFDNNEFKNYQTVKDTKAKKMKYHEDDNGVLWIALDDSALAPTDSEFEPKETIEFVLPEQKDVIDYEYKYISDDKFEEIIDIKTFPLVDEQIYFNLYTKFVCNRLAK